MRKKNIKQIILPIINMIVGIIIIFPIIYALGVSLMEPGLLLFLKILI